nr:MAG TPA_asm: hypothetical protein [Caudoviricetes sp.]
MAERNLLSQRGFVVGGRPDLKVGDRGIARGVIFTTLTVEGR